MPADIGRFESHNLLFSRAGRRRNAQFPALYTTIAHKRADGAAASAAQRRRQGRPGDQNVRRMKYVLTALMIPITHMYAAIHHGSPLPALSSDVAISGVIELETIPDTW